jgi:hypothetical protein
MWINKAPTVQTGYKTINLENRNTHTFVFNDIALCQDSRNGQVKVVEGQDESNQGLAGRGSGHP